MAARALRKIARQRQRSGIAARSGCEGSVVGERGGAQIERAAARYRAGGRVGQRCTAGIESSARSSIDVAAVGVACKLWIKRSLIDVDRASIGDTINVLTEFINIFLW